MKRYVSVLGVEKRRHELGLTREALAEQVGVSIATMNRIAQRSKPGTLPTVCRLADALGHVLLRIGQRCYRVTPALLDDQRDEVNFDEFTLALSMVSRFLGCDGIGRQGLGYAHLATAAEAREAHQAIERASRHLGKLFATEKVEPEEALLLRECVLDVVKPALTVLHAYARIYPAFLRDFLGDEKRAVESQLEQPA